MYGLLNTKLAPVIASAAFFRTSLDKAAGALRDNLQKADKKWGVDSRVTKVSRTENFLSKLLDHLLPLTNVKALRYLLVETTGAHIAVFGNGWPPGPGSSPYTLAMSVRCEAVDYRAMPIRRVPGAPGKGYLGVLDFGLYASERLTSDHCRLNKKRGIMLLGAETTLDFHICGDPLPFENTGAYKAKKKIDRFTFQMLHDYLRAKDVRPFDENFYRPQKAYLIEIHHTKDFPQIQTISLDDAWQRDPYWRYIQEHGW